MGESSEVADLLRASDAFLLSTHGEGMSNALLEGMACGLPCLASRSVGGAAELLEAGRGMLLPDGDAAPGPPPSSASLTTPPCGSRPVRRRLPFVAAELSLEAAADRLARAYALIAS